MMKKPDSQILLPIGHEVPRGARLVAITSGYEELPEAIPCGLPTCHAKHKKGYVVEFTTAEGQPGEGMVGHICGSHHFGEVDWKRQMKEHRARERLTTLRDQVEYRVAECQRLEPLIDKVQGAAKFIAHARETFEIEAKEFHRTCEEAARRNGGLIVGKDWSGKPVEVRMRNPAFWTRQDHVKAAARLLADLRTFERRAAAMTSMDAMKGLLQAMGAPADRARELLSAIIYDLEALAPAAMTISVQAFRAIHRGEKKIRISGGQWFEVWCPEDLNYEAGWEGRLDLGGYPEMLASITAIRDEIVARRAAA